MHRLMLATLLGSVVAGSVVAGTDAPVLVVGKATPAAAPAALVEDLKAQQQIDAATAAALIGALQSRFEGQKIELQLGDVRSQRVSLRDLSLQGEAKIRFEGAQSWLPVRFEALYDTSAMVVESPHMTLGANLAQVRSADALPLAALRKAVDSAMDAEFQSNAVDVSLGQARIVDDDGSRYVVQARGTAVFDGADRVPVTVRALYDHAAGRWLDPQYDFDVVDSGNALAAR
jgi:hypothetical protein